MNENVSGKRINHDKLGKVFRPGIVKEEDVPES